MVLNQLPSKKSIIRRTWLQSKVVEASPSPTILANSAHNARILPVIEELAAKSKNQPLPRWNLRSKLSQPTPPR